MPLPIELHKITCEEYLKALACMALGSQVACCVRAIEEVRSVPIKSNIDRANANLDMLRSLLSKADLAPELIDAQRRRLVR